jgi:hypothetical protein
VLLASLSLVKTAQIPDVNIFLKWLSFDLLHPASEAWRLDSSDSTGWLISIIILFVTGFFANPNLLTLHRFYQDRLRKAYLRDAGTADEGLKLAEIIPETEYWGPYPLINTCLNLFNQKDKNFTGTKGSDYFGLSPLFCVSELTRHIKSKIRFIEA